MSSLDIGSTMLISGVICGLSFVFLLTIIKRYYPKSINGAGEWICACVALSTTLVVYSGALSLGSVVELFIGRFLFLIGMALLLIGFERFAGTAVRTRKITIILICYTIIVTAIKIFDLPDSWAVLLTMLLAISLTHKTLHIVKRLSNKAFPEIWAMMSLYVFEVVFFSRILFLYIYNISNPLLSQHVALRAYTVGFIGCFISLVGSILLITAKRLRHTLETAAVFKEFDAEQQTERWRIGEELWTSVGRNELEIHYQPRVDVHSQKIVAVEALIRWKHPHNGYMRPDQFISIAEENGFIHVLGAWVLHESIEYAAFLRKKNFDIRVSVNISAKQLAKEDFVAFVKNTLDSAGIAPSMIELELTETIAAESAQGAVATLQQLRDLGLDIAIDDFGTGYSSLSYLSKLPVTCLKIDKSFVHDINKNDVARTVIRGIIRLSEGLGLRTVAEGVEYQEQLDIIQEEGAHEYQGYLYSKPILGEALISLLTNEVLANDQ